MRILLVEDEPDLGAAIEQTLKREHYVVDWVLDGTEAWSYLETYWTEYTLAIFDWLLPGLPGLELCRKLRKRGNPLPVLMLTARDGLEDRVTGLDAGADDYLTKPFGMAELLARLRALQRRSPQLQPQQLQVDNLILNYGTHTVCFQDRSGNRQPILLTHKEFQLLECFMKRPNQIISGEQIIKLVWAANTVPTGNVVSAQIRLLRHKLIETGSSCTIETFYGTGYRLNITCEPE